MNDVNLSLIDNTFVFALSICFNTVVVFLLFYLFLYRFILVGILKAFDKASKHLQANCLLLLVISLNFPTTIITTTTRTTGKSFSGKSLPESSCCYPAMIKTGAVSIAPLPFSNCKNRLRERRAVFSSFLNSNSIAAFAVNDEN